ncbi:hypothetical protein KOR34_16520 [Posidoniimonas corsicana]|uniref:Zinc-finger domain-containing protein n=1 Tax=Posidoniimonas corsicana TaxID=1938618 RepID=A0A5C5VGF0_9BACT|nr:hypothetical protein [Posidoniimonas corsicana]TWT36712.1 hypothetical protein KOR34_16520 [Posidoniimonas corsicana]
MNCDQVFNVLTRGPFPSGSPEDFHVQQHLDGCLDCWRIAEALRPAEHLFQEAIPPSETRDLPGYWGDSTPPATLLDQIASDTAKTAVAPKLRRATEQRQIEIVYDRTARRTDMLYVGAILLGTLTMPLLAWWLMSVPE